MGGRAMSREGSEARGCELTPAFHILATTMEGTRCALNRARQLTDGLAARIVVLVPRMQLRATPFDPAPDEQAAIIDAHRALAAEVGAHVVVLCCVCRRVDDVVHSMLGARSLVIVGGRRRVWWPSREERLAARLTARGYPVVFAQVGAEPARARTPAPALTDF